MIKSPLRYPGGKSRQAAQLAAMLPRAKHFISPFTGGGSVELAYMQSHPDAQIWLNDIDPAIATFWRQMLEPYQFQANLDAIVSAKNAIFAGADPRTIGHDWRSQGEPSLARTYILNRLSFSGNLYSGGFKPKADRFTLRNIEALRRTAAYLQLHRDRVHVSNLSWENLIARPDSALFLDPPYPSAAKSNLYKGHKVFDMLPLARWLSQCPAPWLLTIDDTPDNQALFGLAAHRQSTQWHYGATNVGQSRQGNELIVASFAFADLAKSR